MLAVGGAAAVFVQGGVRAIAHPPIDGAAQGVAQGGHHHRGPEQFGIELHKAKDHGLGAHGQQGGRNQRDHEHRAQAKFWQGQGVQQLVNPGFHGGSIGSQRIVRKIFDC